MNLTQNEKLILETLRTLNPYEVIQITADKDGKPDSYLVVRTHKTLLIQNLPPTFIQVTTKDLR